MADPFTIHYGPWTPDLANVAGEFSRQFQVTDVLTADCNNVYYADGCYRSLPSAVSLQPITQHQPLDAFTGIDVSGKPAVFLGTSTRAYTFVRGAWFDIGAAPYNAQQWQFAQFGQTVYAVDGSIAAANTDGLQQTLVGDVSMIAAGVLTLTGSSITANVLTVGAVSVPQGVPSLLQVGMIITGIGVTAGTNILSLGTGTGGAGTYNVSTTPNVASETMYANIPPIGNVIATVGQFLMLGDIAQQFANNAYGNTAFTLGTGDGVTKLFTGSIPNVPVRPGSVTPSVSGVAYGTDTGRGFSFEDLGYFSNAIFTGNINYATGALYIIFNIAPANGAPIVFTYAQTFAERLYWSAIGLPTFFPAPLTNAALAFQSGYQDMESDLGPIMAVVGYPLYAVIFQRSGITRATYQGGNVVYAFATYEWKKGLISRRAYVQVGPLSYFLADDGFYVTDGANVNPIGTAQDNSAGIDNWFWTNVNKNALNSIWGAYDATLRSILFAIPTGTNTSPDTLLIYNVIAQRWTKAAMASSLIWSDTDGTRRRVGVMSPLIGIFYYSQLLTGAPAPGYLESGDLYFIDGQRRLCTGVRPQVNSTDKPLVVIGTRDSLQDAVQYGSGSFPGRFSKIAPALSGGIYMRVRLQSAAAQSIHGATLFLETEGGI